MKVHRILVIISLILVVALLGLFFIRFFSEKQVDDVSPGLNCSGLVEKADVLYVIPKFDNISIGGNRSWCDYLLSLNKTLALHGVYHSYNEFSIDRNQNYLDEGLKSFRDCFGKEPERFKAPRLEISENNEKLIDENGLKLDGYFNQLTHKVYHCNDSGRFPNWFIDLF